MPHQPGKSGNDRPPPESRGPNTFPRDAKRERSLCRISAPGRVVAAVHRRRYGSVLRHGAGVR